MVGVAAMVDMCLTDGVQSQAGMSRMMVMVQLSNS